MTEVKVAFTVASLMAGAVFRSPGTEKGGVVAIILGPSKIIPDFTNVCINDVLGTECLRLSNDQILEILNKGEYTEYDFETEAMKVQEKSQPEMAAFDAMVAQLMAEIGTAGTTAGTEPVDHKHDKNCGCETKQARREIVRD